jgi:hypothetical protein
MTPPINNQTLHAILQYVMALGVLCSAIAPLTAGVPWLYALLQRVAGAGLDVGKVFGARRIHTPTGPAPAPAVSTKKGPPMPPVTTAFALLLCLAAVGCSSCTSAQSALAGALSVEQMACILAQDELGAAEPKAIADVCAIPPTLITEIAGVLAARKKGHEMALATRDGGAK